MFSDDELKKMGIGKGYKFLSYVITRSGLLRTMARVRQVLDKCFLTYVSLIKWTPFFCERKDTTVPPCLIYPRKLGASVSNNSNY